MTSPQYLGCVAVAAGLLFSSAVHAIPILGCGVTNSPSPYTVNCDQSVAGNINNGPNTTTYRHNGRLFIGFDNASAMSNNVFDPVIVRQRYRQYGEASANGAALLAGMNVAGSSDVLANSFLANTLRRQVIGSHQIMGNELISGKLPAEIGELNSAGSVLSVAAISPVELGQTALTVALGKESRSVEFVGIMVDTVASYSGAAKETSITQQITTVNIGSGGNLPGLAVDNANLAQVTFAVSEPNSHWLRLIALSLFLVSLRSAKPLRVMLR